MEIVGYKLVEVSNQATIQEWGGIWGQCPAVPNPITLPNEMIIYAPVIGFDYNGYMLINWEMEDPGPTVPYIISPRQVRLLLLQQGELSNVEAMIAQQDEATRITWEYATEFRRNDPLLNQLAANLGYSEAAIDQFFIAASAL